MLKCDREMWTRNVARHSTQLYMKHTEALLSTYLCRTESVITFSFQRCKLCFKMQPNVSMDREHRKRHMFSWQMRYFRGRTPSSTVPVCVYVSTLIKIIEQTEHNLEKEWELCNTRVSETNSCPCSIPYMCPLEPIRMLDFDLGFWSAVTAGFFYRPVTIREEF